MFNQKVDSEKDPILNWMKLRIQLKIKNYDL